MLFAPTTSFLVDVDDDFVDDDDDDKNKREEEEEMGVLAARLLDAVGDEVRCSEALGAFNIFVVNTRAERKRV